MPASLFSSEMDRSRDLMENQFKAEFGAYNIQTLGMLFNNENDCMNAAYDGEPRSKKSQNTTECVPVPSSEHVAEIVGRQGCKIKALRAKTNTYIKTPVRGEEPVFVVTGRKEDVCSAKREILSAADHFSQIRAQRKNNLNGALMPGPNSNIPGQTTISVRVPYRVVGLVVGPKGATIKRIQQLTSTYIVTPSREKEPIFEVTGLPESVDAARREIEAHIAARTTAAGSIDNADEDYNTNMDSYTNNLNAINNASFFKNDGFGYSFAAHDSNNVMDPPNMDNMFNYSSLTQNAKQNDVFNSGHCFSSEFNSHLSRMNGLNSLSNGFSSSSNGFSSNGFSSSSNGFSSNGFSSSSNGFSSSSEGFCSPTFEAAPGAPPTRSSPSWPPDRSTSTLTDSGISLFGSSLSSERSNSLTGMTSAFSELFLSDHHPPARRINSDPVSVPEAGDILANIASNLSLPFTPLTGSSIAPDSLTSGAFSAAVTKCTSSSSSENLAPGSNKKPKRECMICYESEVVAALVPCGHNSFCMECAGRLCKSPDNVCPVCKAPATQAIRILP